MEEKLISRAQTSCNGHKRLITEIFIYGRLGLEDFSTAAKNSLTEN